MNSWLSYPWLSTCVAAPRKGGLTAKSSLRDALDDVVVCLMSFTSQQDTNSKAELSAIIWRVYKDFNGYWFDRLASL